MAGPELPSVALFDSTPEFALFPPGGVVPIGIEVGGAIEFIGPVELKNSLLTLYNVKLLIIM